MFRPPTGVLFFLASIPPTIVRVTGIVAVLATSVADYVTGVAVSLSLLYIIPVTYLTWYGGRASGFVAAAIISLTRGWESVEVWPEMLPAVHLWNAVGSFAVFGAFVWGLDRIHHYYRTRLRVAEERYTQILEVAIEGILAVDLRGTIQYTNSRAAVMLGYTKEELLGKTLFDFVQQEQSRYEVQTMLQTETTGSFEVRFQRREGNPVWVLASVSPSWDKQGAPEELVILLTDVTPLKTSEEELKRRYQEISAMQRLSAGLAETLQLEDQLENAVTIVLDVTGFTAGCIYLLDDHRNTLVLRVHKGFSPTFALRANYWSVDRGLTGQVATTGRPQFLVDATDDPVFDQALREAESIRAFASIPLVAEDQILGVLNIVSRHRHEFPREEQLMLQTFGKQIGIALDNARLYETAREREHQVRKLTLEIVGVQEEERKRIARELHDGLSQLLSTLKINIELAAKSIRSDLHAAEQQLKELSSLADEAQEEAKQLAFDLRPAVLDDFGLKAALRFLATNFERRAGKVVEWNFPAADMRFDSLIETTVYRIVQELLTNIAKHSEASRVFMQLVVRKGVLALSVADNGRGFEPAKALAVRPGRPHFGLRNVKERVEFLGGSFRIESVPGHGSEFLIEIPFEESPLMPPKEQSIPSAG